MRVLYLFIFLYVFSINVQAQDFVSRYRQLCEGDTTLSYISVSPKMMEMALKSQSSQDNATVNEVLRHLKSMQIISSDHQAAKYFDQAEEVLQKNSNRFEPIANYKGNGEECLVSARKRGGTIVELVFVRKLEGKFVTISFTGQLTQEMLQQLVEQFSGRSSSEAAN